MLVIEYLADKTIVKFRKDWHPDRISKAYNGQKYTNFTSAGLKFQEVVLQDKLRACYERVKRRVESYE